MEEEYDFAKQDIDCLLYTSVYINPGSVSQPRGPIHEKLYAKVIINDAKIRVEYYTRDHELYSELTQEFER